MNNKDYNLKLLSLTLLLLLLQGCARKIGFVPQAMQESGVARVVDFTNVFSRGIIQEDATLMATDRYLFATGTGSGFGYLNFSSGTFISGASAFPADPRTPNFIDGNVANVLSMAVAGNNLYISSRPGLYQIDLSQIQSPTVTLALPYSFPCLFGGCLNTTSTVTQLSEPSKELYRWDSMVYVPTQNQLWGFRGNVMYRLNLGTISSAPNPQVVSNMQLDTSCDQVFKRASTLFQGRVYVAGCSRVLVLTPEANGSFSQSQFPYQLNPVQVVSTENRLYVHHQPTVSWGRSYGSAPAGIYIFDASLNYISYFELGPVSFAVSPDDRFLFANEDNVDVGVYRIP